MYRIYYYEDKNGRSQVADYIKTLASQKDKDSRIKLEKIRAYVSALSEHGLKLGEPYIKHLDGDIWELRPIRDRILFAAWDGESFVLLHQFMKKTQKTPREEIQKAKRNLSEYRERRNYHEKEPGTGDRKKKSR